METFIGVFLYNDFFPSCCYIYFFKKIYLPYLFLAVFGLCCYVQAFSSCSEWELLSVAVFGFLTAVASPVAEHGL